MVRARRLRVRRVVASLLLLPALQGCYLLHAAQGQMALNAARQPIERVVADERTPPDVRAQLELATRAREFAVRELGLPDNGSYRTYADVGRPYVVWNVFAAPEFAVEPKTWCFPVAGCVAYRGYFAEDRARDFALGLEARGYDVLVGGVPAYSTLGHFEDPVLNTMLGWGEVQLVGTIVHELAHQRLYVPDDSAFNEAFATVVEHEGVRRWLHAQGRDAELGQFLARRERGAAVARLLADGRERLRALYGQGLPPDETRVAKATEFERLRTEYGRLKAEWGRGGWDGLFGPRMNNASLLAIATYHDCVPGIEARLAALGGDLPAFYAEMAALGREPRAVRHARVCANGVRAITGPAPAAPPIPSSP